MRPDNEEAGAERASSSWRVQLLLGILMPRYFAALTIVLMLAMVALRVVLMRRPGIKAMKFGDIDKKDFLIPPFALFYFYTVFAAGGWPTLWSFRYRHD